MKSMFTTLGRSACCVLAGICLLTFASAQAGYFKTITIDGDFSDWTGVPVVDSDPVDNAGFVDIADTQIANDASYLYIRNTFHTTLSLGTFIALDSDSNTATGYDIFGLGLVGSEAGWQNDFPFTEATGVFNDGKGMSGEFFGSGAALLSPFAESNSRELALSLDIIFNGTSQPVFASDTFKLLIWTDLGSGDVSAPITYTLAPVPEPGTAALMALGVFGLVARRYRR